MDASFWLDKWQSNQIGFHADEPHPLLVAHWDALDLPSDARVFAPLCGKSPDLLWLRRRGHPVVGIELSEIAVRDFYRENALEPAIESTATGHRFEAGGITIHRGDFFALTPQQLGPIDAIYDRAALIALPPEMRMSYVAHLGALAGNSARALMLITVGYDETQISPPPFVVPHAEVASGFEGWHMTRHEPLPADVKGQPGTETLYLMRRNPGHA